MSEMWLKQTLAADEFMTRHGADGEIFNIGNGDNRSINQIASYYDSEIEHLPARLEPFKTLADHTKAKTMLGWEPTGNVEEWLKTHLENGI